MLSSQPWAVVNLSQVQWGVLITCVLFVFFSQILTPKTRKWLLLPAVLMFANIGVFTAHSANDWQVYVMDVGQGLAVVVQKNNHTLLYDTGASYPSGFSMAESVLLPYFQQQGIKGLDWLIVSHDDNDHAGGYTQLNQQLSIKNIMTNDVSIKATHPCLTGHKLYWQQLTIEVLSPNQRKGDDNDDSCVVKIFDQHHSLLLTGDISKKIEKKLVNRNKLASDLEGPSQLNADILIAPHHGSKTSSSTEFVKAVAPKYVVFSSGYLNQWSMPSSTVVERYRRLNIHTLNTADSGMITFRINHSRIEVRRYRFDDWPYWFAISVLITWLALKLKLK
ncbi:DNA internalization-related competence protein ComEC/Rec2 [Thalassotalea piscium]